MAYVTEILATAWTVLGQMAPYLLFGFLMAGALSVLVSPEWVERHLGGRGLVPIAKSALFGVPLPLCSCGVIPVTASIRRHGASRGATTAFLLSTPQTGVDSIFATWALLGPVFAVFRPLMALLTGILGGSVVSLVEGNDRAAGEGGSVDEAEACQEACCTGEDQGGKVVRALRYGFVTLPRDIARALIVGILIAALISALVPEGRLAGYLDGGIVAMLAMMAVGIPIYVCSTASIPIALGFMHLGASPGAALVFLIAGPATNAAALVVVWRLLGRKTATVYLLTVALGSLAAGFALDALDAQLPVAEAALAAHGAHDGVSWFGHASAVVLLGLLVPALWPRHGHSHEQEHDEHGECDGAHEQVALAIGGMTCSHCAETVGRTLREGHGVAHVDVDLDAGRATVAGCGMDTQALAASVRELGYEVTED